MLIYTLYFILACRLMAQRKDVIILSGPYSSDTMSLNKGLQA